MTAVNYARLSKLPYNCNPAAKKEAMLLDLIDAGKPASEVMSDLRCSGLKSTYRSSVLTYAASFYKRAQKQDEFYDAIRQNFGTSTCKPYLPMEKLNGR